MILLTGATGVIGRQALRRIPVGTALRVLARDPAKIDLMPEGAELVVGAYSDARALAAALHGVRAALLVTTSIDGADDIAFLRAATQAGVRQVVKISAAAVQDPLAQDAITTWQRESERLLCESGLGWTILRPRAYMSNCLSWAGSIRAEGIARVLYSTSANAVIDPRDVAEVAVRALLEPGHLGRAYTLTGPAAITARQQVAVLARLLGRALSCEEVTADQAFAGLRRRYPQDVAQALLTSSARQLAGAKTAVTDTVERLLGRPAGSFEQWAEDHLAAFADPPLSARLPGPRRPSR
jgi:uncharacterized protein YbjT (DUF2867 family)